MVTQVCQCLCRKFLFGSTSDLKEQLNHIQSLFPASDLYAVGSSAGTGLLVRYLGEQGEDTPFKAAFAMCPGYNTEIGFKMSTLLQQNDD